MSDLAQKIQFKLNFYDKPLNKDVISKPLADKSAYAYVDSRSSSPTKASESRKKEKFDPVKAAEAINENIRTKQVDKSSFAHVKSRLEVPTKAFMGCVREKATVTKGHGWTYSYSSSASDEVHTDDEVKSSSGGRNISPRTRRSPTRHESASTKYNNIQSKLLSPSKASLNNQRSKAPVRDVREDGWGNRRVSSPQRREELLKRRSSYDDVPSKLSCITKSISGKFREKVILEPHEISPFVPIKDFFSEPDKNDEIECTGKPKILPYNNNIRSKIMEPTKSAILKIRDKTPTKNPRETGWNSNSPSRNPRSTSRLRNGDTTDESGGEDENVRAYSPRLFHSKEYNNITSKLMEPTAAVTHNTREKAEEMDPREAGWGLKHTYSHTNMKDSIWDHIEERRPLTRSSSFTDIKSRLMVPTAAALHGSREKVQNVVDPREIGWLKHLPSTGNVYIKPEDFHDIDEEGDDDSTVGSPRLYSNQSYQDIKSKLLEPTQALIHSSRDKVPESDSRIWHMHRPNSMANVKDAIDNRNLSKTIIDPFSPIEDSEINSIGSPRIYHNPDYNAVSSRLHTPTKALIYGSRNKFEIDHESDAFSTTRSEEKKDFWKSENSIDETERFGTPKLYPHKSYSDIKSKLLEPTEAMLHGSREKHALDPREQGWNHQHSPIDKTEDGMKSLSRNSSYADIKSKLLTPTTAFIYSVRDKAELAIDTQDLKYSSGGNPPGDIMETPAVLARKSSFANIQSKLTEHTSATLNSQRTKVELLKEDNAFTVTHNEGDRMAQIYSLPRTNSYANIQSKLHESTVATLASQVDSKTKEHIHSLSKLHSSSSNVLKQNQSPSPKPNNNNHNYRKGNDINKDIRKRHRQAIKDDDDESVIVIDDGDDPFKQYLVSDPDTF